MPKDLQVGGHDRFMIFGWLLVVLGSKLASSCSVFCKATRSLCTPEEAVTCITPLFREAKHTASRESRHRLPVKVLPVVVNSRQGRGLHVIPVASSL